MVESFCWRVGGRYEIQINKDNKVHQKPFHDELFEMQKQQIKLLEETEKRFQTFQSEMLEKHLQSEAVEK